MVPSLIVKTNHVLRYHFSVAILFAMVVIVNTRPMIRHPGETVASHPFLYIHEELSKSTKNGIRHMPWDMDIGIAAWVYAWDCHQILKDPIHLFQANIYYPYTNTLAMIDNYLGLALIGLPVQLLWNRPALTYNVILLLAFSGTAFCLYLYVFHRTQRFIPSAIAGLAAAALPYHYAHLHTIHKSMFLSFPLSFLFLEKWLKTHKFKYVFFLGITIVFQIISTWYLTVCLGFLLLTRILWFAVTKPQRIFRKFFWIQGIPVLISITLVALMFIIPYIENNHAFPEFKRDIRSQDSVPAGIYLTVPNDSLLYSSWLHDIMPMNKPLKAFFPGFSFLLPAVWGVIVVLKNRRRNVEDSELGIYLFITGLFSFCLSLGPFLIIGQKRIHFLFYYLFEYFPPMKALRGPQDFVLIVYFAGLIFMGFGLVDLLKQRSTPVLRLIAFFLPALLLAETIKKPQQMVMLPWGEQVPACYHQAATLPANSSVATFYALVKADGNIGYRTLNHFAMYYSIFHFHRIPEGHSAYKPPLSREYGAFVKGFPSQDSIDFLQALNIDYILIDLQSIPIDRRKEALAIVDAQSALTRINRYPDSAVYLLKKQSHPSSETPLIAGIHINSHLKTAAFYLYNPGTTKIFFYPKERRIQLSRSEYNRNTHAAFILQLPVLIKENGIFRRTLPRWIAEMSYEELMHTLNVKMTCTDKLLIVCDDKLSERPVSN